MAPLYSIAKQSGIGVVLGQTCPPAVHTDPRMEDIVQRSVGIRAPSTANIPSLGDDARRFSAVQRADETELDERVGELVQGSFLGVNSSPRNISGVSSPAFVQERKTPQANDKHVVETRAQFFEDIKEFDEQEICNYLKTHKLGFLSRNGEFVKIKKYNNNKTQQERSQNCNLKNSVVIVATDTPGSTNSQSLFVFKTEKTESGGEGPVFSIPQGEFIGDGSTKVCLKVRDLLTGREKAISIAIEGRGGQSFESIKESIASEYDMGREVQEIPHCLVLQTVIESGGQSSKSGPQVHRIVIVSDLYEGKEWSRGRPFFEVPEEDQKKQLNNQNKQLLLLQITDSLAQMHERGVLHGDLRYCNILVSEDCRDCVILDFGCSKKIPMEPQNPKMQDDFLKDFDDLKNLLLDSFDGEDLEEVFSDSPHIKKLLNLNSTTDPSVLTPEECTTFVRDIHRELTTLGSP